MYPRSCKAYIKSISEYPAKASTCSFTFTLSLLLRQVLHIIILPVVPSFFLKALNLSKDLTSPHILHFFMMKNRAYKVHCLMAPAN